MRYISANGSVSLFYLIFPAVCKLLVQVLCNRMYTFFLQDRRTKRQILKQANGQDEQ